MIEALLQQHCRETGLYLAVNDIAALGKFASLVAKWNRIFNLVASSSANDLFRNHVIDCLAAVPYLDGDHIVDVGAGAGFPGIVVAIMRRQSMVTLVESSERKSRFLRQVAIELSLANVEVVCERIENWRPLQAIDDIVCRGYGSLRKFYHDTSALHATSRRLVAMKGAPSSAEIHELQLDPAAISVQALAVQGWDHRHLVIVNCAR